MLQHDQEVTVVGTMFRSFVVHAITSMPVKQFISQLKITKHNLCAPENEKKTFVNKARDPDTNEIPEDCMCEICKEFVYDPLNCDLSCVLLVKKY